MFDGASGYKLAKEAQLASSVNEVKFDMTGAGNIGLTDQRPGFLIIVFLMLRACWKWKPNITNTQRESQLKMAHTSGIKRHSYIYI